VLRDAADPFVRSVADEFSAAFAAAGGEVVTTTYTVSDVDFDPVVATATQFGAQALYVPAGSAVANRAGSAAQAQGLDLAIVGSDLWIGRDLDLQALEGAYFVAHYSPDVPDPLGKAWRGRYQSAFAVEPDTLASLGYDAANILVTAIGRSSGASPSDVARTLENTEYFGASGHWRFDAYHNPLKDAAIMQVRDGGVRFVGTGGVW